MATKINVSLNRRVRCESVPPSSYRRWFKTEHKNIKLVIDAEFDSGAFTRLVMDAVDREYPGWSLTGYALPERQS